LVLSNNRLKGLNNWLENRVKTLEENWKNQKMILKTLKCIAKNLLASVSFVCENCENLENKVHYLIRTVDKLSKGKSNFENVLASQNCVSGKVGLGFKP